MNGVIELLFISSSHKTAINTSKDRSLTVLHVSRRGTPFKLQAKRKELTLQKHAATSSCQCHCTPSLDWQTMDHCPEGEMREKDTTRELDKGKEGGGRGRI